MKDLNNYWKERLSAKRVLITGGTTGIGREITLLLTSFGAKCFICGRHEAQLNETLAEVRRAGSEGSCAGIVADLAREEGVENLFKGIDSEFGSLDILVNNAAVAYGSISEGGYEDWKYVVQSNLLGYMACSHEAARRMEESGRGHIVNIGSMSADVREVGSSVYVATKAGIQGFSEALRKELNPKGIKVSLIEPGAVDTDLQDGSAEDKLDQIDRHEMIKAEDIAMSVGYCLVQPERCDVVGVQIRPHMQLI